MQKTLSIVTTLYQSANYIDEYYSRISASAKTLKCSYEIIFVDDGSPDNSREKAINLAEKDNNIKVVELSKNFGHHHAMMAGLSQAVGDFVFLIDCDLEERPEKLVEFWEAINSDDSLDMIYGVQEQKSGNFLKKQASRAFYKVFNFFSFVKIPDHELVSRLMKRSYVDALLAYKERSLFIPGIWADVGFNRKAILCEKSFDGFTTYSVSKRIALATDAITSFSTKPLTYIFYSGIIMSLISGVIVLYLIINKLLFNATLDGWTSVLASLYLIGGMIIFSIGVIGIYLSKVFIEVKGRPNSIIRHIYKSDNE